MSLSADQWAFIFGVLGNIISFCVFLSPLPTFYQIYKKKTSEGFQSIPYVIALFSAMLWIYYAFLKPNSTLLITINSFGVFIETVYIAFFLFYASKKSRIETMKMVSLLIVVGFGLIVVLTHFFSKGAARGNIVGWICLVFSLCVFVAPLAIVRKVIKTKSVEFMPISLSAFLTMSAVVWFFYGLLRKDVNIAVPNVLGFIFGIVQMILYQIYHKREQSIKGQKQELPQVLKDQIIIVDGDMLNSDKNKDEKIEDPKLGSLEKIPVVLCRVEDGIDAPKDHCIQMEPQPPAIRAC